MWKRKYSYIQLKKYQDNTYGGLHISENDMWNVYKYTKLVEKLGKDYELEKLYPKLSEAMQLPINKIRELVRLAYIRATGDNVTNEDGEEGDIIGVFQAILILKGCL